MRIGLLIAALAAGVSGLAAITRVAAFAPGPGALAATYHASAAAVDEAAPLVMVKWKVKWKKRPPGWSRGRKTGWGGWGLPPGQLNYGIWRASAQSSAPSTGRRHQAGRFARAFADTIEN